MAGKNINHVAATIVAATTGGAVTVASTTGFYKNAVVWLAATGQPAQRCVISSIISATQLGILFRNIDAGTAPTYGRSDVSAYNGGTVTQHEQFIYNNDDLPLS